MIAFACEKCGKNFNLKPEFAGRKTTCSGCKAPLVVPAPEQTMVYGAPPGETVAPVVQTKIAFSCAKCGMKFSVKLEFAGRTTQCPTCKNSLVVPAPDQTMAYAPALGKINGAVSSFSKAGFDPGVTLEGSGGSGSGLQSLQKLIDRDSHDDARYVLESEIARGGMGAVLRAVDCDIRREVAVKYLLDQDDANKKLRFVEEAQITGQLEHPNIVPIHELGVDAQKRLYFSMKMVKGRSLGQILKALREEGDKAARDYSLSKLLGILVNVCNALAYAHARGVVHRDLKPANIMVGDFGEVYVMDWGLAKVLKRGQAAPRTGPVAAIPIARVADTDATSDPRAPSPFDFTAAAPAPAQPLPLAAPVAGATAFSTGTGQVITNREGDADLTQEGSVLGTPAYMPPEQATGHIHAIDERSDIYSVGAILYEMLTLHPPVDREGGYWSILMRVTKGEIAVPEKRDPQRARAGLIPPELSAVAMKALAKQKDDRYQTVESFRKDIELFLEGRSVSAKEDTRQEMIVKFVKRNKAFSAVSAAAAAALLLVIMGALVVNFNARRATQRAYEAYAAEQKIKAERTRRAVPALVEIARRDAEGRQFKTALEQVKLALEYEPDDKNARLLHGQLLIVNKDFTAASVELAAYLAKSPNDPKTRELKKWCDRAAAAGDKDTGAVMQISQVLMEQNNIGMAEGVLQQYAKSGNEFRADLLHLYRWRIDAVWPGHAANLTVDKDGHFHMKVNQKEATDLAVLKEIPLRTIQIQGAQIRDLSALQGMPLVRVFCYNCPELRDLNDLKGLTLTSIDLELCPNVRDVAALKDMPLTSVRIHSCGVSDLAGLKGAPLETLSIFTCPVRDLSPLAGMPLKTISITKCAGVRDLTPLRGMLLTSLNLSGCPIVQDLSPLEAMPLTRVDLSGCTEVRSVEALRLTSLNSLKLRGCGFLTSLKGLEAQKLATLDLGSCARLVDISAVKNMPLTSIALDGCTALTDLSALKGKPFTTLDVSGCIKLTDLSPLKGMPLSKFKANGCGQLADLSPLHGMALDHIELKGCPKITDLTPLKEAVIQIIYLNGCAGLKNLDGLQGMRFTKLELHGCVEVENLDGLKGVPLSEFHVEKCPKITNLDVLKTMPLTICKLHHCENLVDISGLAGTPSFKTLSFNNCPNVEDWSLLKKMQIREFAAIKCGKFHDLTLLADAGCVSLNISECGKITDLTLLKGFTSLTALHLGGHSELTDLTFLKDLKLTQLNLQGSAVKDLTPIRGLPITNLNLDKCAALTDLTPLDGMKLTDLRLPPQVTKGIEVVRRMETLTTVNLLPAAQFWPKWDALQSKAK